MNAKRLSRFKDSYGVNCLFLGIFPALFYFAAVTILIVKNNFHSFWIGLRNIFDFTPGQVSDFLVIGGLEASLINAALIGSLNVLVIWQSKCPIDGKVIAAFFTVLGFSFVGKTIFNIIPIYLGGWIYWHKNKVKIQGTLPVMMFATSLAPVVSWLYRHQELSAITGSFMALVVGMALGYLVVPVARRLHFFHKGHSLYHIGFCTGLLATAVARLGRIFNLGISPERNVSLANSGELYLLFGVIVFILLSSCLLLKKCGIRDLGLESGGVGSFEPEGGPGSIVLNMAIMAVLSLGYVRLVGGILCGPVVAGIFTLIGFGACGKNLSNCLPVMAGAIGGIIFLDLPMNDPGLIAAVLFATTLAPMVTNYGRIAGVVAGFCHLFMIGDTILLHGGLCLYNNGFTGGLVAGTLVSLFERIKYKKSSC